MLVVNVAGEMRGIQLPSAGLGTVPRGSVHSAVCVSEVLFSKKLYESVTEVPWLSSTTTGVAEGGAPSSPHPERLPPRAERAPAAAAPFTNVLLESLTGVSLISGDLSRDNLFLLIGLGDKLSFLVNR